MVQMDEDREMERFIEAADYLSGELNIDDAAEIAGMLCDWAMDSQGRNGIIFQIAAAQEFGATLSAYAQTEAGKYGISLDADFSQERAILREIHASTRRHPMKLYRGTDHSGANALESWTTDREIAEFYVARNEGGEVIERVFQADEILGTHRDGIGLECAGEVVVINR